MIISRCKSVKKSQKFLKKATNYSYSLFFKKKLSWWFRYISIAIVWGKKCDVIIWVLDLILPTWWYKSVKRSQKILKKATIWTYTWFFEKKIALANLIHINSYSMRKKVWCHYIVLGLIFSHLGNFKHHFRIY